MLHDRFLSSRSRTRNGSPLGRVFSVIRQTWLVTDDPKKTKPREQALATHRTASDAADLARDAASAFRSHGFHKPSGAWWAADGELFHRFQVAGDRRVRATPVLLGLGVAALALTALGAALRKTPQG
ncbi:hypothetical protein [Phenylobacterium sp.]|uniref:hypothetical protein n=1 Tax=Phenylobacterium sp. TaxID=1871053 RepID=UPI003563256E